MINSPKAIRDDAVFLIDGSGYIFRAYFAIRHLNSSGGVPTNAVYGFTTMLLKLLKEHNPRYLAIAFDTGKPTFRHKIYADYKANRPPAPPDLIPQFDLIHRMVDAFRIKRLLTNGYEADDLIGTAARIAKESGHQVVIVTGDKDFMQLVDTDVWLLDELRAAKNNNELMIDREQVRLKFGVDPEQVVDILALAGDASDNVPGVRGIGEKTAVELVKEFGSLENILAAAPLIKQKSRREKLIEGKEMALLSKELVTIDCHAAIDIKIPELVNEGPSIKALVTLFKELDFKRLLDHPVVNNITPILAQADQSCNDVSKEKTDYFAVTTQDQLTFLIKQIQTSNELAIDTETDSLDSMIANLVGISLCWKKGHAAYIPLAHDMAACPTQLSFEVIKNALEPIIQDPQRKIYAQNAKYDLQVLFRAGFKPFPIHGDPMIASYLLDADSVKHNLDDLSERYLNHQNISYEEVCGKGKTQILFSAVPLEKALPYAAEDADMTFQLAQLLGKKIKAEGLEKLYQEIELPLETVLCDMERAGICIDTKALNQMSKEFADKLKALENKAYEIAGVEFNLASPKQVGEILFGKLQLQAGKKTKTGHSTNAQVLEQLSPSHPLPKILLEHRQLAKLKNTYVDALPKLLNPQTKRLHTHFNQAVTATGRLSSSDPNLQNIPIRSPEGRRIREAFIAKEGSVLISLDYSQIELRILAEISKDPVMLDAFNKNEDVHQRTASEVFNVALNDVTKEQRSFAKTINFGLLYGMGAHKLSQTLGISRTEAANYIQAYYDRYQNIYAWQENLLKKAHNDEVVYTLMGRRRKLPSISSSNMMVVKQAERMAINTPIQGSAADIIKKAMIETHAALKKDFPEVKLLLQVHDELILEAPKNKAEEVMELVQKIMCNAYPLSVPTLVDCGIGESWAAAH